MVLSRTDCQIVSDSASCVPAGGSWWRPISMPIPWATVRMPRTSDFMAACIDLYLTRNASPAVIPPSRRQCTDHLLARQPTVAPVRRACGIAHRHRTGVLYDLGHDAVGTEGDADVPARPGDHPLDLGCGYRRVIACGERIEGA